MKNLKLFWINIEISYKYTKHSANGFWSLGLFILHCKYIYLHTCSLRELWIYFAWALLQVKWQRWYAYLKIESIGKSLISIILEKNILLLKLYSYTFCFPKNVLSWITWPIFLIFPMICWARSQVQWMQFISSYGTWYTLHCIK